MSNRRLRYVALATAVAALAGACGSSGSKGSTASTSGSGSGGGASAAGSKGTYNIGLSAGITGAAAAIVKGEIEGIQAAFSVVNGAGGVAGHKLNLITDDTQNIATNAVASLTKLATENNVVASFGDILANNCQAQIPVSKQEHIPTLCGTLDPAQLQPVEPYVYTEYGSEITQVDAVGSIITGTPLNLKAPKVALVYVKSSSTVPLMDAVTAKIKQLGGSVVLNDPLGATLDLSVDANKVIQSGANVVFEQIIPQQLQSLSQGLKNAGSSIPIVAEATTSSYQQMMLLQNPNIYELSLAPFVDPNSSDPAVKDYVAALAKQGISGKSAINGQSIAITYAAAMALADALKTCGGSCTGPKVDAALQQVSVNLPGINTDYSYTSSRHYPQTSFLLYQYSSAQNDVVQLAGDLAGNPIPANAGS